MLSIWSYDYTGEPLVLDATVQAVVTRSAQVTGHPVEASGSGAGTNGSFRVSDHRRREPKVYRSTGLLVDWPSDALAAQRASQAGSGQPGLDGVLENAEPRDRTRASGMLARLQELDATNELVNLDTDQELLASMSLDSLTHEEVGDGAIQVQMTWKEVLFVSTSTGSLKPLPKPEASKKAAQRRVAQKKGTTPKDPAKSSSLLYRMLGGP